MCNHDPEKNGGVLRGSDGRVQGRNAAAAISFVSGIGLLIYGAILPGTSPLEARIGPAVVALVFSLLVWGLLTVQNVVQLVRLLKGTKEAPHDR